MRNRSSPFTMRATDASSVVCSASPNRLDAPAKSRFHSAWPGSLSRAGQSTRFTSGRDSSQRATFVADADCRSSRTERLRMPRSARKQSSGDATSPNAYAWSATVLNSTSFAVVIIPITRSECPARYFVPAWIEMSTPCSSGRK